MRPIIVPLTHNKVRRDPILGRDPWFENPGFKQILHHRYIILIDERAKSFSRASDIDATQQDKRKIDITSYKNLWYSSLGPKHQAS